MQLTKSELFIRAHANAKAMMSMLIATTYKSAFSMALRHIHARQRKALEAARIEEVNAALEAPKVKPTKVKVLWSESGMFHDCEELDFEEFESQAHMVAKLNGRVSENGYSKTKITVYFDGPEENDYTCRLDLAIGDEVGFQDHMEQMINYFDTATGENGDWYRANYKDLVEFGRTIDYSKAA